MTKAEQSVEAILYAWTRTDLHHSRYRAIDHAPEVPNPGTIVEKG